MIIRVLLITLCILMSAQAMEREISEKEVFGMPQAEFLQTMPENLKAGFGALYRVGMKHLKGDQTVPKNYRKAMSIFEKVAEQDYNPEARVWAELRIGQIYFMGDEKVPRNYSTALKWLNKAAEQIINTDVQGYAKMIIGQIYLYGDQNEPRNYFLAYKYVQDARNTSFSSSKDTSTAVNLWAKAMQIMGSRDWRFVQDINYYLQQERDLEDPKLRRYPLYFFGHHYFEGYEIYGGEGPVARQLLPKDYEKAIPYLKKLAAYPANEEGRAQAELMLGKIYFFGDRKVAQDYEEARKWFMKAAYSGMMNSRFEALQYLHELEGIGR